MNLDWQKIFLNLRNAGLSSDMLKRRVGMCTRTIERFSRGDLQEPRFSQGLKILDLHEKFCPEKHSMKDLAL